jgi:hypothetical protein
MNPTRTTVIVPTIADGSATVFSPIVSGKLVSITYTKDGSTPYDDTVDFTITNETTGLTLWSQSNVTATTTVAPRQATHTTAGVAALYASGGVAVLDDIILTQDRVKIVLAQGGDTKTGTFIIVTA